MIRTIKLLTLGATALIVLIAGCKKDTFEETPGLCPEVSSTSPLRDETNVPLIKVITVTFNKEMDPRTMVWGVFTLRIASADVQGNISYDNTNATLSFVPTDPLSPNTTYTGKVTTEAKDPRGNALQADYIWTFSTGSTLAPVVIQTDPVHNATNVPLNKVITAGFNMPMDPLTLNTGSFLLHDGANPVSGVVSYVDSTASFVPSNPLLPNTVYTATITTDAENMAGTPLANDHVWTFTTASLSAPTVISTDPSDNDVNVTTNKTVTATFSEPMDPLTISTTSFTLRQGVTNVPGIVSYVGSTASYNPTSDLASNTVYTATITTTAENLAGTPMANDYVWDFTTEDTAGAPFVQLNSAEDFGIMAGVGISNNSGISQIHDMNVGITPGVRSSITGFPPGIVVNGAIYASDDISPPGVAAMLTQAKQDMTDAYLFAEGASTPAPITVSGDQGGLTLTPGIYKSTSTLLIQSGNLTLDAQGDPNAVWIFQISSDFTTVGGAGGSIILVGGAQARNIFWQVGSSATIGGATQFKGNILALTSITMNSLAVAEGRMLAINGGVVLTGTNTITRP